MSTTSRATRTLRVTRVITYTAPCPCTCGPVEWTQTTYDTAYDARGKPYTPSPTYVIECSESEAA